MESEKKMRTLDSLKPGERAIIREYIAPDETASYLTEMGLLIGTNVVLIKFAPLGDPLEIRFRGYNLSIRRSIAKRILVEKVND